jgi:hypothetical protein
MTHRVAYRAKDPHIGAADGIDVELEERMARGGFGNLAVVAAVVGTVTLAGCGDPDTRDRRGYTKAPLEVPGVRIKGQGMSEMRRFGPPRLPVAERIELTDSAAAPG